MSRVPLYGDIYDFWIRNTTDETEENEYFKQNYASEILASDVGRALAKFVEPSAMSSYNKNKQRTRGRISIDKINKLRHQARISCKGKSPATIDNPSAICEPNFSPCVFDLKNDPCETTNLASSMPEMLSKLERKIGYYGRIAKNPRNKPADQRSNPGNFNGTWTWWYDVLHIDDSERSGNYSTR